MRSILAVSLELVVVARHQNILLSKKELSLSATDCPHGLTQSCPQERVKRESATVALVTSRCAPRRDGQETTERHRAVDNLSALFSQRWQGP